jgi:hypothetical protein
MRRSRGWFLLHPRQPPRRGLESSQPLGRQRWRGGASLSWLRWARGLGVRWDRDAGRWFGFLLLACALVCVTRLSSAQEQPVRSTVGSRLGSGQRGPEQGVTAVALGDELLGGDPQAGRLQPRPMGRRVGVAPPHGHAATEPAVLDAGPGLVAGGREQPAPGRSQPAMWPSSGGCASRGRWMRVDRHTTASKVAAGRVRLVISACSKVAAGTRRRARRSCTWLLSTR